MYVSGCFRGVGGEASIIYTNIVSESIFRVGARSGGLGKIQPAVCLLMEEYNVVSKSNVQISRFV